jgi:SulP family sulfate permease
VHDELEAARRVRPDAKHVLLVFSGVNFIDVAGCEFLTHAARMLRDSGATLYLCNLKPAVQSALVRGGFLAEIGENRVYSTKTDAIRAIYSRLNAATCAGCRVRVFSECQTNLPDGSPRKDTDALPAA